MSKPRSKEDYELGNFLGDGSFCYVVQCREKATGKQLAQKVAQLKQPGSLEACVMEAHCLRRLADSPHVPTLHSVFESPVQWLFVMDLCEGGDLWELVRRTGCIDFEDQVWYVSQMLAAVAAVHEIGIVHRDLKCENFMLASLETKQVRLIDFGTAIDTRHPEVTRMPPSDHHVGTPNFMAPEAINDNENDFRSDYWSLGCSFYQLLIGAPPFAGPGPFFTLTRAQKRDLWLPSIGLHASAKSLVNELVQVDPAERLGSKGGIPSILQHSFFVVSPTAAPTTNPQCDVLRSIGQAIYAALGPLDEAQVGMMMEDDPQEHEERERKAGAAKAWSDAQKIAASALQSSPENSDLRALAKIVEVMSAKSAVECDILPQVEGLSTLAAEHLARFVEQAKQLRKEIENPEMPELPDDSSEDKEGSGQPMFGAESHSVIEVKDDSSKGGHGDEKTVVEKPFKADADSSFTLECCLFWKSSRG